MKKILSAAEAARMVGNNTSIMIGGFLQCGTPTKVIDELVGNNVKGITLIANDTCVPDFGRGKLIVNKCVKKAIVAHIGTNPETGRQMNAGELEVDLVPMGTLVERIHAGGSGLGGFLTPTGVGTSVEEGKKVVEVDGKKYLFEKPIRADFAIVYGTKADKFGNVFIHGTARNHNLNMATAADVVIVEADELTEDCLDPDEVTIPGVFIDYIVTEK